MHPDVPDGADPDRPARLRVLLVCGADFRAPSEKQTLFFAHGLAQQGHAVALSLPGDPATAADEPIDLAGLQLHRHRFSGRKLRRSDRVWAGQFGPDLIHALNPREHVIRAATGYREASGAPVCVHFEDDEWGLARGAHASLPRRWARGIARTLAPIYPPAWPFVTRRSLAWARDHAAGVDALTNPLADHVSERLGRPCETVTMLAVPRVNGTGTYRPSVPPALDGTPLVVFTGSVFGPHEADFRLALNAVGALQAEGRQVGFLFAGMATRRMDLAEWAAEAGLRPGTAHGLGYLNRTQIQGLFERADVLVQPGAPSDFNRLRLPSKLPSYLASGVPTVTFESGFGEELVDGVEVLKTRSADPSELARRIAQVLDDDELRASLAVNGPRAAQRHFDLARNTEALVAYYRAHVRS